MRVRQFLFAILFLVLVASCKSPSSSPSRMPGSLNHIADISIGDSKNAVLDKLSPPGSKSVEKYQAIEFEVLEYSGTDGIPLGYLTLEPKTGLVVGRTIWISRTQPESNFSFLQKHVVPQAIFAKTLITCDKHHGGEVRVDSERGISVGIDRGSVFLISWSNSQLTKLRIEQFGVKCPERQKRL